MKRIFLSCGHEVETQGETLVVWIGQTAFCKNHGPVEIKEIHEGELPFPNEMQESALNELASKHPWIELYQVIQNMVRIAVEKEMKK